MPKIAIITADGARARFITAELQLNASIEGTPRLEEHAMLANPLGDVPAREESSDRMSRKPSGAGPRGGGATSDDHRDRHQAEDQRRFARQISEAAERFVAEQRPQRVVLVAAPRLLGVLRRELNTKRWSNVDVLEIAEDLSGKSLPDLRQALTKRGILPDPVVPRVGVYRLSGQEPSTR